MRLRWSLGATCLIRQRPCPLEHSIALGGAAQDVVIPAAPRQENVLDGQYLRHFRRQSLACRFGAFRATPPDCSAGTSSGRSSYRSSARLSDGSVGTSRADPSAWRRSGRRRSAQVPRGRLSSPAANAPAVGSGGAAHCASTARVSKLENDAMRRARSDSRLTVRGRFIAAAALRRSDPAHRWSVMSSRCVAPFASCLKVDDPHPCVAFSVQLASKHRDDVPLTSHRRSHERIGKRSFQRAMIGHRLAIGLDDGRR